MSPKCKKLFRGGRSFPRAAVGVDRLCIVEGITCSMSRVRNKGGVDRLCTIEGITCYDSMSRVRNKEVNQRHLI